MLTFLVCASYILTVKLFQKTKNPYESCISDDAQICNYIGLFFVVCFGSVLYPCLYRMTSQEIGRLFFDRLGDMFFILHFAT